MSNGVDPNIINRLHKSLNGTNPQNPRARIVVSQTSTKDLDPVNGSKALAQAAAAKTGVISSLNAQNGKRKFMWKVPGFGWGYGNF